MNTAFDVSTVTFAAGADRCEASLYCPRGGTRPPVMVMGHGFAGERQFALPAFAERFAQAGCAVLLFDYRGFGGSEGEPRRLISVNRQLDDWRAAIACARNLDQVDGERLLLWGTSFGGGHVLSLAAEPGIRPLAVIAHVPHVDGRASSGSALKLLPVLRLLTTAMLDVLASRLGRKPVEVPVVGVPGSRAILSTGECEPGYRALIPEGVVWANRTPARVLFDIVNYRPGLAAAQVACPTLVVAARRDSLIPVTATRAVAERIPRGNYQELDCNHFEPYRGAWFDRNIAMQLDFLDVVVPRP